MMNFLLLPLLVLLAASTAPAAAQSPPSTPSISVSNSFTPSFTNSFTPSFTNSFTPSYTNSFTNSYSPSYTNSMSITISASLNLQPPRNVQNLTPNQRELITVAWNQPAGYFYPSYNLYYSTSADATLREITGISALQYVLKYPAVPQILPGLTYTIYVTGVAANGIESPKSAPLTTTTSSADPKLQPAQGITNIVCSVSAANMLTCSFTPGTQAYKQLNVRIKCPRGGPGAPRIRRAYIRTVVSSYSRDLSRSPGQTCRVSFDAIYPAISSTTSSGPYTRFGRKFVTRVTTNPASM